MWLPSVDPLWINKRRLRAPLNTYRVAPHRPQLQLLYASCHWEPVGLRFFTMDLRAGCHAANISTFVFVFEDFQALNK